MHNEKIFLSLMAAISPALEGTFLSDVAFFSNLFFNVNRCRVYGAVLQT